MKPDDWSKSRRRRRAVRHALLLAALALAVRIPYFNVPVQCDEAATFVWNCLAGDDPVWHAATHYDAPNNHVLHSVLLGLMHRLTGWEFPMLRLPALLAGVACVPVTYFVGRRVVGPAGAFLGAMLLATSAWAIRYSTDARGYSLAALLGVVAFGLAWRRAERSRGLPWAAGVACGLALYAVPTMAFLVLGLCGALWAGGLLPCVALAVTALATAVLLYAPMLSYMGADVLWRYPGLAAVEYGRLLAQLRESAATYGSVVSDGALPRVAFAVAAACGLAVLMRRRRRAALWLVCVFVAAPAAALLIRRAPPPRTMTYLAPFACLAAGAGLAEAVRRATGSTRKVRAARQVGMVTVAGLVAATGFTLSMQEAFPVRGVEDQPSLAPVAWHLRRAGGSRGPVFARTGLAEPLRYELHRLGEPMERVGTPGRSQRWGAGLLVRQTGDTLGEQLRTALAGYEAGLVVFRDRDFFVQRVWPSSDGERVPR